MFEKFFWAVADFPLTDPAEVAAANAQIAAIAEITPDTMDLDDAMLELRSRQYERYCQCGTL